MTNPISAGIRKLKSVNGSLAKRHFGASRDFYSSFKSDLAGMRESSRLRREAQYSVHPDESQKSWGRKKTFFLAEIQFYQVGFMGALIYSLATLTLSPSLTMFALWCAGWYAIKIRDTYRARLVAANWQHRDKPLSLSWKVFFKKVKKQPLILIPAWRIFK